MIRDAFGLAYRYHRILHAETLWHSPDAMTDSWQHIKFNPQPDNFWLAFSQWETSLQSNAVSHWLGANLESALIVLRHPQDVHQQAYLDNPV